MKTLELKANPSRRCKIWTTSCHTWAELTYMTIELVMAGNKGRFMQIMRLQHRSRMQMLPHALPLPLPPQRRG
jgi:hypothetical protein